MDTVAFTRMADGTREEYEFLEAEFARHCDVGIADRALGALCQLRGPKLGYRVDRYTHSLQSATRALRDGASEEQIVCALLHDIGDLLAPRNHDRFAAAVLEPYVCEESHWVVAHHGLFQGYYYFHHLGKDRDAREKYRGHPHYEACVRFCERWDQSSFDPDYDTLELETFEPMVRRLFAREPWDS